MMSSIALIGIPLEDLFTFGAATPHATYVPGITDSLRAGIIKQCAAEGVPVCDLQELYLGDDYERPYKTDRYGDIPEEHIPLLKPLNYRLLYEGRNTLLNFSRYYALMVAVAPSHLAAITMYDSFETISRFDYHGDYPEMTYGQYPPNFANYMRWVEHNLIFPDVTNYCVTSLGDYEILGRRAVGIKDDRHRWANLLDIDVDCIDDRFAIQDCYRQVDGPTGVSPDDIIDIVSQSRASRVGFFEYRQNHDRSGGRGIEMISKSIIGRAKRKQFGQ